MDNLNPDVEWYRLWNDVRPPPGHHPATSDLGEYAALARTQGAEAAERAFLDLAAHLRAGCGDCQATLDELGSMIERTQRIGEALRLHLATQRQGADAGADERESADVQRYRQRRWDPSILADIVQLEEELRSRIVDAG